MESVLHLLQLPHSVVMVGLCVSVEIYIFVNLNALESKGKGAG